MRSLSQREIEVLRLLALGSTGKAAAQQLDISPETVKNHTSSARLKLQCRTTLQAVLTATQKGLL